MCQMVEYFSFRVKLWIFGGFTYKSSKGQVGKTVLHNTVSFIMFFLWVCYMLFDATNTLSKAQKV